MRRRSASCPRTGPAGPPISGGPAKGAHGGPSGGTPRGPSEDSTAAVRGPRSSGTFDCAAVRGPPPAASMSFSRSGWLCPSQDARRGATGRRRRHGRPNVARGETRRPVASGAAGWSTPVPPPLEGAAWSPGGRIAPEVSGPDQRADPAGACLPPAGSARTSLATRASVGKARRASGLRFASARSPDRGAPPTPWPPASGPVSRAARSSSVAPGSKDRRDRLSALRRRRRESRRHHGRWGEAGRGPATAPTAPKLTLGARSALGETTTPTGPRPPTRRSVGRRRNAGSRRGRAGWRRVKARRIAGAVDQAWECVSSGGEAMVSDLEFLHGDVLGGGRKGRTGPSHGKRAVELPAAYRTLLGVEQRH
jgi:hypothetical protein